jgi:hypothetical protein
LSLEAVKKDGWSIWFCTEVGFGEDTTWKELLRRTEDLLNPGSLRQAETDKVACR